MAMSEEQWVVTDFREVSLPGSKVLMDEFQIGKVPRASTPESPLLFQCLYMFATVIFLWYLA